MIENRFVIVEPKPIPHAGLLSIARPAPAAATSTVSEPLDSYGAGYSTVVATRQRPMGEQDPEITGPPAPVNFSRLS